MQLAELWNAGTFVYLALMFYVLGFLVRDEVGLRIFILMGTFCYIIYYRFAADEPLWDATYASIVIAAVNIFTLSVIIRERSILGMKPDYLELYKAFPTLNPGQFRKVMKHAVWENVPAQTQLTEGGERLESLYYIRGGHFEVVRGNNAAQVPGDKFIGEVAFLQDGIASASVTIPAQTSIVRWSCRDLQALMKSSPGISNALIALFSQDMARKIAGSMPDGYRQMPEAEASGGKM